MEKEIKIDIPQGTMVDVENSDFVNGVIKFKEKPHVQKKWEDFGEVNGYYIDYDSRVFKVHSGVPSKPCNKSIIPTKSLAEAILALCQLLQWRNKVWKEDENWSPDWDGKSEKYCIDVYSYEIKPGSWNQYSRALSFRTKEIRDQFLIDHRDLIETAKELL